MAPDASRGRPDTAEGMETTLEHRGNTTIVRKPFGTHYILYNIHEGLKNPDDLPKDVQAVTMEMFDRWTDHPTASLSRFSDDEMYRKMFDEAGRRGIPILLMSPYLRGSLSSETRAAAEICECGLVVTSALLAAIKRVHRALVKRHALEEVQPIQQPSISPVLHRRSLLRQAVGGVVGGWLVSPIATTLARSGSVASGHGQGLSSSLSAASHAIHPEIEHFFPDKRLFALLMTEKVEWLMKEKGLRNIATIVGADHTEFEEVAGLSQNARLDQCNRHKKFLQEVVDPASVYTIMRMERSKEEPRLRPWKHTAIWENPYLRGIMNLSLGDGGIPYQTLLKYPELRQLVELQ